MKYLCLVYLDEAHWSACPDQDCFGFASELAGSGRLLAAEPLHPGHTATTVRVRNGQVSLYDGPFAQTEGNPGRLLLVDAKDLNEALSIRRAGFRRQNTAASKCVLCGNSVSRDFARFHPRPRAGEITDPHDPFTFTPTRTAGTQPPFARLACTAVLLAACTRKPQRKDNRMSTNDTYLAVFLGSKTSPRMKAWMALPEAERRAKEQEGMAAWKAWVEKHHAAVSAMGGPLGKTKKISERGIADVSNEMGAFMVVRADRTRRPPTVREASAFHDLSGRVRGGHAGSADTGRLTGGSPFPASA